MSSNAAASRSPIHSFGDPRLPARIWSKLRVDEAGCWIWFGAINDNGYGRSCWTTDRKRAVLSHRLTYQQLVGPIAEGLSLDHLCRVRACCNPAHLEPVTHAVNVRRGVGFSGTNARKTHCIAGHPLSGTNLVTTKAGRRKCRECQNVGQRRRRLQAAA